MSMGRKTPNEATPTTLRQNEMTNAATGNSKNTPDVRVSRPSLRKSSSTGFAATACVSISSGETARRSVMSNR
jgi:hypothetical protein